jgi:hypothetical protein
MLQFLFFFCFLINKRFQTLVNNFNQKYYITQVLWRIATRGNACYKLYFNYIISSLDNKNLIHAKV